MHNKEVKQAAQQLKALAIQQARNKKQKKALDKKATAAAKKRRKEQAKEAIALEQ